MTSDTFPSGRLRMRFVARYGTALLATGAALLAGRVLAPLIGDYLPYIVVFPVIALSAWYCGLGPSAVATVLALVGLKYWFMSSFHTLGVVTVRQALAMLAFLVASGAIVSAVRLAARQLSPRPHIRFADPGLNLKQPASATGTSQPASALTFATRMPLKSLFGFSYHKRQKADCGEWIRPRSVSNSIQQQTS
jgi:hypothetical protein